MIELKNIVLNKKVLEIGGPSQLLNYLYDSVESIEMLNHKKSYVDSSDQLQMIYIGINEY